jgi:hypothetical protein
MNTYPNFQHIVTQILGLGIIFIILHLGLHIPALNLFLFWILPFSLVQYGYLFLNLFDINKSKS